MGFSRIGQTLTAKEVLDLVKADLAKVEREITLESVVSVEAVSRIAQYMQANGGKRLRPILVLLSCRLVGDISDAAIQLAGVMDLSSDPGCLSKCDGRAHHHLRFPGRDLELDQDHGDVDGPGRT